MCWTVGLKGLRSSPVGLYRDPSLGTRQMGIWQLGFFTAQGTPLPPSAGPRLLPKFGARSGMRSAPGKGPRRRCRDAGSPLTLAEPPPPGGRIRLSGGRRPAQAASAPNCAPCSGDAGAALPTVPTLPLWRLRGGRRGRDGPLAGREAAPGGRSSSRRRMIGTIHDPAPASGRWRPPEQQPRLPEPRASPPRSPPHFTRAPCNFGKLSEVGAAAHPASWRGWRRRRTQREGRSRERTQRPHPTPPLGSLGLQDPSASLCS